MARLTWRRWYDHVTGNDPIIHANRFATWEELSPDGRAEWKRNNPMPAVGTPKRTELEAKR